MPVVARAYGAPVAAPSQRPVLGLGLELGLAGLDLAQLPGPWQSLWWLLCGRLPSPVQHQCVAVASA